MTTDTTFATTSAPADDDGDVAIDAPKPTTAASGRFSGEIRAKLAELRQRAAAGETTPDDIWMGDDAPVKTAPPKVVTPSAPAVAPPRAAEAPPAATSPAAESVAAFDALRAREAEITRREAAIAEREGRYGEVGEKLVADPLTTITEMAKKWLGPGATDDEIAAEVSDVLTVASLKLAGATIDDKDDKAATRRLQREMREMRAQTRRKETAHAEALRQAEHERSSRAALEQVSRELQAVTASTPWLAAEDAPADLVWDMIRRHHDQTGTVLTVAQAAKALDEDIAASVKQRFSKLSHLLQPPKADPVPTKTEGQQGDQQRRSRPLSNVDASEDAPAPLPDGFLTPAQMKAQSMKSLKGQFARLREQAAQRGDD